MLLAKLPVVIQLTIVDQYEASPDVVDLHRLWTGVEFLSI
jgi:hypothetical protein